jgi:hypothetical protein
LSIWNNDTRRSKRKEIAGALRDCPTDELAIADLEYRKLIIADEIQNYHRLVERYSKRRLH